MLQFSPHPIPHRVKGVVECENEYCHIISSINDVQWRMKGEKALYENKKRIVTLLAIWRVKKSEEKTF
jgi:hypothetical protein